MLRCEICEGRYVALTCVFGGRTTGDVAMLCLHEMCCCCCMLRVSQRSSPSTAHMQMKLIAAQRPTTDPQSPLELAPAHHAMSYRANSS